MSDWLRDRRDNQRRAEARQIQAMAPMRAITDPRDAAIALMAYVAAIRGDITPEQEAVMCSHIEGSLGLVQETEKRLALGKFAAKQSSSAVDAIDAVKALLQNSLGPDERKQLSAMLEAVAAVHGGPSEAQQRFIENVVRAATLPK